MTNINESIFPISDLPKGWTLSPISSLAKFNPATINGNYPHKSIEYLDIANVSSGTYGSPTTLQLEDAPSRAKRIVVDNDVILSTVRPGNRAYAFMRNVKPNLIVSTGFAVLQATNSDSRYLYYIVTSNPVIDYLASIAEEKTAYPSVNPSDIEEIIVPVPPLSEQRAIAHILGTLDDKIELNRRMNETLEGIARALFKSWFIDFDPVRAKAEGRQPFGMDEETAALFPDQFEDSELGEIPKGWKVVQVQELVDFRSERMIPEDKVGSEKYISLDDMPSKSIDLMNFSSADDVNSSIIRFQENDILFGAMRPYFHKVGIAPFDGITRTTTFVLRPLSTNKCCYSLLLLSSNDVIDYCTTSSVGTTIPYVKWDSLSKYQTVIPDSPILARYQSIVWPLIQLIKENTRETHLLKSVRENLLPKLISGDIQVNRSRFGFGPEGDKVGEV